MDAKSLEMLEFPKVREIIAGYTSFTASRQLALEIVPSADIAEVRLRLDLCSEARRLQVTEPDYHVGEVHDIREFAIMAARGKTLDTQTLSFIAGSLTTLRLAKSGLQRLAADFPLLWDIAKNMSDNRSLEKDLNSCISPGGELLDSASEELQAIRHQVRQRRQEIISRLEDIVRSPRGEKVIQEPLVTEREGRYVIPVKVEAKREMQGIIHDVSNTGATVFIEPFEAVDMGNELRELVTGEKREIERVLRRLSEDVGAHAEEISADITLAAELDLIMAKAKYARRARASEAHLVAFGEGAPPVLRLDEARHPLLGDKAVPLSVRLGKDFTVLVITGPNTGGKTVALKTIGLLSLMTLAGLPIPAKETSTVPVFDGIYVDIGDEQSIEQTLSTFSWHVTNISHITHVSTSHSMVLLDELGTSTDPAEGSALARAILFHFLEKGTMAVATTHLGDLKAFAYATKGMQNASLDFDPANFAPTFHLTIGIPGGSNALETASRLGLDADIVDRARGMMSQGARDVEALISSLNNERDASQTLRQQLESERVAAEKARRELENRLADQRAKERAIIQETRDKVVKEAADLQHEIRDVAAELRKEKSKEAVDRTRRALASLQERLRSEVFQPKAEPEEKLHEPEQGVKVGDTVWLKDASLEARVLRLDERAGDVEVQAGQTRIKMGLDAIQKIMPGQGGAPRRYIPVIKPTPKVVPSELMMLGRRAEEVEDMLNRYLDDAAMAGLQQVRIVHGSGMGVLREIVRDQLAKHPLVKSFRPGERGEGGNGVTMVKL